MECGFSETELFYSKWFFVSSNFVKFSYSLITGRISLHISTTFSDWQSLASCEKNNNRSWCARISSIGCGVLWVYAQEGGSWINIASLYLVCIETSSLIFCVPISNEKSFLFPTSPSAFVVICFHDESHSDWSELSSQSSVFPYSKEHILATCLF